MRWIGYFARRKPINVGAAYLPLAWKQLPPTDVPPAPAMGWHLIHGTGPVQSALAHD